MFSIRTREKKNAVQMVRTVVDGNNFALAKWNACLKTGRNESTYERLILYAIQTQ